MVVESTERNQIVALEALSNKYKRNRMKHVEQMIAPNQEVLIKHVK